MSGSNKVPYGHLTGVTETSGATLVNGAVIVDHPCVVFGFHVAHAGGSAAWVQVHDSATVPAEGAVPLVTHAVSANSDADIEGVVQHHYFENGVYICESSTVATKTLSVSSDLFISVVYAKWHR